MMFTAISSLILVFVQMSNAAEDSLLLPEWFWNPPSIGGECFAVGYSRRYEHLESSFGEAHKDAIRALNRDLHCQVDVPLGTTGTGRGMRVWGKEVRIESDTAVEALLMESAVRLDSCVTADLVLMLVGTSITEIDKRRVRSPVGRDIPRGIDQDRISAAGSAQPYVYEASSWQAAEFEARLQAVGYIQTSVRALTKSEKGVVTTVTDQVSFVEHLRFDCVARRRDPLTGEHLVIVIASKAVK